MGQISSWLFPQKSRYLPGHRWINIGLRTLHLIGIAGLGGGYFYPAENDLWQSFLHLTLISGLLLSLLFVYNNGICMVQLRGQVILVKLLLLCVMSLWPNYAAWLLVVILVLSGWISHAPAAVRYYSVFHGRRVERL